MLQRVAAMYCLDAHVRACIEHLLMPCVQGLVMSVALAERW